MSTLVKGSDPAAMVAESEALQQSIGQVVQRLESVVVTTDTERAEAELLVREGKSKLTAVEKMATFFVRPLYDQYKEKKAFFDGMADPVERAMKIVNQRIGAYVSEQERQVAAERRKIAEAQIKAAEAKVAPPAYVPLPTMPAKTVVTTAGTTTYRDDVAVTVVDATQVPYELCTHTPSLSLIKTYAKDHPGEAIPGVQVEHIKVPVYGR